MIFLEHIIQTTAQPSPRDVNFILKQMECLQNKRIAKWNANSDQLSKDRIRLAKLLLKRMDEIDKEKGILLIKPYMTLKSNKRQYFPCNNCLFFIISILFH